MAGRSRRWIALTLLLLVFGSASATPSNAQEPVQPSPGKARKATLQELYAMFFAYAVHVETVSVADEKRGIDRTFYRSHLQKASGLDPEEYAEVLASAKRFVAASATPESADQPPDDQGVQPPALESANQSSSMLGSDNAPSLQNEITSLRQLLGQERADLLDAYLQNDYAVHKIAPASEDTLAARANQVEATTANVTIDGGTTCANVYDNYGNLFSICIDSQMSYLGPGSWVELYTFGQGSPAQVTGWTEAGILSVNNQSTSINCVISGAPNQYLGPCTRNIQFTSGNGASYKWTSTFTAYLIGGGSALHWDPNPPTVTIKYPSIQSVSPTSLSSGQSQRFTLTGAFCGNNISCAAGLISPFQNPPSVSDAMNACVGGLSEYSFNYPYQTVTTSLCQLSANAQGGTDQITVNNGFGSGSIGVTIIPSPTINGPSGSISPGNPIQVFAGQQVSLSVAAPSGLSITSQTWSFGNSADVVGGYNASGASGQVIPVTGADQTSITFYFIAPGQSETVTVNVTYNNGQSASSTATFNVQGPTNVNITSTVGQTPLYLNSIENPTLKLAGVAGTNAGIEFQASSNLPPSNQGGYSWVQTITRDTTYFLGNIDNSPTARYQCPVITSAAPQLDTEYPYSVVSSTNGVPNDTATDSPSLGLQFGETAWSFAPTMYLMWMPNAGSTCSGGTCSIPIPLARVSWSWSWDAIDTLALQDSTQTQWILNACSKANSSGCVLSSPSTDPNQSYPTWSGTDEGGNQTRSCTTM